jgi:hypothetical protein
MKLREGAEWVLLLISFGACIAWRDAPKNIIRSRAKISEVFQLFVDRSRCNSAIVVDVHGHIILTWLTMVLSRDMYSL